MVGLTTGQWLSLLPAALGVAGLWLSFRRRVPARWNAYRLAPAKPGADDDAGADASGDEDVDDVLLDREASRRSAQGR
jgi:hypothetical protein